MTKILKAQLLASVALAPVPELVRELIKTFTLAVYRLVQPQSAPAQAFGCFCHGKHDLNPNCPFHGLEARRLING